MSVITDYHHLVFHNKLWAEAINRVIRKLEDISPSTGLVCSGISGMMVAIPVVERTGRELAIVRKATEEHHSCFTVEGHDVREYVIIDDFIESGQTVKRMISLMDLERKGAKCIGIMLYRDSMAPKIKYKRRIIPIIDCA